MAIVTLLLSVLVFVWDLFKQWINLFIAPIQDFSMLWIIIPIYLNWLVTEIFQEKKGTSFGNAITNGVVMLWVGIDWTRQIMYQGILEHGWGILILKGIIALLAFAYGITIIIVGLRAKKITKYIGRIREISYFCIAFTPIFYGVIQPELKVFVVIILFFPVFYFFFEFLDFVIPDPKTNKIDEEEVSGANNANKEMFQGAGFSDPGQNMNLNNLNTGQPSQSPIQQQITQQNSQSAQQSYSQASRNLPQRIRKKYYSYPYSKNYNPGYDPFQHK